MKRHIATAAALGAVVAAGCGTKTLDVSEAESTIAKRLTAEEKAKVKVDCPDKVEIKRGDTFDCRATASGKRAATVRVTQLDDKGRVRWILTGPR